MHDVMIWVTVGGFIAAGFGLFAWGVFTHASGPADKDAELQTEFDAGMARWEGVNYENLR